MGCLFALTFFIIYAARTIFIGNTAFGGPSSIKSLLHYFLSFPYHSCNSWWRLGLIQIILAFKDKLHIHRKIGPWASIIWFFTAITGVAVYVLLYILYQVEKQHHCLKLH